MQEYVKKEYPNSYSDLSTVFMESCFRQLHENGIVSMINIPVWMSLASYRELRKELLTSSTIINMLHLGRGMFGSDYGTTAFSYCKKPMPHYKGFYKKFFVKAVSVESEEKKKELFFEGTKDYQTDQSLFLNLPNEFIAYWATQSFVDAFNNGKNIGAYATVFEGLKTRDKDRFLRLWFEISDDKWKPYAKGGSFRRWYGNNDYVVNWGENGDEVRNFKKSSGANFNYYFSPSITYTAMTMSKFSGRYIDEHIFGGGGGGITNSQELFYLLGFVNSKPYDLIISAMKSTVNFEVGQIGSIPLIIDEQNKDRIIDLVKENIELSREEWDSYEYSWDFKCHPLIQRNKTISESFFEWKTKAEYRFQQVKNNEIELNELFISIYGMNNELDKDVEDNDVTMRKADLKSEIKSLISYAVGCMFGRYSLDHEGLICNNRYLDSSKYKTYIPEKDNILYITDEDYFSDDIVGKFILWLETVYGKDNLEENLNFIASSLGNNKESSRKVIRNYFVNEFFQDHAKIYSTNGSGKKPIYWLLDGGKQNGFKALIYMHRYDQDTMGLVRSDYLIKVQDAIESAFKNSEYIIANTTNAVDKARATKARAKYVKQMSEIKLYFQALSHIALQRIELDLDDGVKVNYAKFQGIEVSNEGTKKQTIDLLAKI
ncbi:MAG: BREX-1 system adenine-specific DNA-methyltransferase PglX [Lachnospiraceae bacterium]